MKRDFFCLILEEVFQGKIEKATFMSEPTTFLVDKQMHIFRGKHAV